MSPAGGSGYWPAQASGRRTNASRSLNSGRFAPDDEMVERFGTLGAHKGSRCVVDAVAQLGCQECFVECVVQLLLCFVSCQDHFGSVPLSRARQSNRQRPSRRPERDCSPNCSPSDFRERRSTETPPRRQAGTTRAHGGGDAMTTTSTEPVIRLSQIPRYFGGGYHPEGSGTRADYEFDHALEALIALTGRGEDDPAVRLIVGQLEDSVGDLLNMACDWGMCIPEGLGGMGIDTSDDDVLFEVTGHRRNPPHYLDETPSQVASRSEICSTTADGVAPLRRGRFASWHRSAARLSQPEEYTARTVRGCP